MSAVGNDPILDDGFVYVMTGPEEHVRRSLDKIQNLVSSPILFPDRMIMTFVDSSTGDPTLSSSDSCTMKFEKPWRVGSIRYWAAHYNDQTFNQNLDSMLLSVIHELKKLKEVCQRNQVDLQAVMDQVELKTAFPHQVADKPTVFTNLIATLHLNNAYIDGKIRHNNLGWLTYPHAGEKRSENYWYVVGQVHSLIVNLLSKAPESTDEIDHFDKIIHSSTKNLTKRYSKGQWEKAITLSKDHQWFLDAETLTPEMKALIKVDVIKDLERMHYQIDGQAFGKDGSRFDEMLGVMKASLFGESEDIHDVTYRLAFLLTQGSYAIPIEVLHFSSDGHFGNVFPQDTDYPCVYTFAYNQMGTVSIHCNGCNNSVSFDEDGGMIQNGKVFIDVELKLNLIDGNIDWENAEAFYHLSNTASTL